MTTYGAVKARSAARAGSIARKPTSQTPASRAAKALPAASKVTSSTSRPSLRPSSRASSTDTPPNAPVFGFLCANTAFPRLIVARSLPVGATSLTISGETLPITGAPPATRQPAPSPEPSACLPEDDAHRAAGPGDLDWRGQDPLAPIHVEPDDGVAVLVGDVEEAAGR